MTTHTDEPHDGMTESDLRSWAGVAGNYIKSLRAELAEARGRWISTSERLPEEEDGAVILVALDCDPDEYVDRYRVLDYIADPDKPGWYTVHGNRMSLTMLPVTHWQPITSPAEPDARGTTGE